MSAPKQKRRKPTGSAADINILWPGEILTAPQGKVLKEKFELNQLNLTLALQLLGFYCKSPESKRYLHERFALALWFIDNRPADYITGHIRYFTGARFWSHSMEREAQTCWRKQIKKYPTDARVLFNAAMQPDFRQPDTTALLKRSKQADATYGPPFLHLAQGYRYKALQGVDKHRKRFAKLALDEIDGALVRKNALGERLGMLIAFTPLAIKFGYYIRARKYANRLRRYKEEALWQQYAETYLLRLDVIEAKYKSAEKRIARLRQLYSEHPSHVASNTQALLTLADLCQHDQCNLAQLLLDAIKRGTGDKAQLKMLKRWSTEIARKRIPNFQLDHN
ncbi:MAG: hypothetical protein WCT03_07660 [Candidatus Obscuribacterales bacterium]